MIRNHAGTIVSITRLVKWTQNTVPNMNGSLTDAVARLYRAGSENSKSTKKLRKAADDLLIWIRDNVPRELNPLPLHCTMYPSGDFTRTALTNPPNGQHVEILRLTIGQEHTLGNLFLFCQLINEGFLDSLSFQLENDAAYMERAADQITKFLVRK